MNYKEALDKLERLRDLLTGDLSREKLDQACQIYGEVEEVVTHLVGVQQIAVDIHGPKAIYPNYIEAGYFSGRTFFRHAGYTQLQKLIGKVRQLANDPCVPAMEASTSNLIGILSRLRECCQYLERPPSNEREVQDILWIMLRSHFDRVDREDTLPRFGAKNYRPDFGIPELRQLIEVKFIGDKTSLPEIQESIIADIPGYFTGNSRFDAVIILVYDYAHKLRDPRKFIEDLRTVDEITDVLVIPGIGASAT